MNVYNYLTLHLNDVMFALSRLGNGNASRASTQNG